MLDGSPLADGEVDDVAAAAARRGLCSLDRLGGGRGLNRLLLGHGRDELAGDLGLLGIELDLSLTSGAGLRRLLVGRRLVLCLLLLERGTFGVQPVLVGMKGVDGEFGVTACHVLVLGPCKRVGLVSLEEDPARRVHVDVGRHRFILKSLAIARHPDDVGLDLILRRPDLGLVPLDLGAVDVVLLLVGTDLELLQHEVLRDLGRLCFEVGNLIGRDGVPETRPPLR